MGEDKQHIFISYAHADSELAHKVVKNLQNNGFAVWIDVQGLTPGTSNWEQAIRNAIADSAAVVLLASPDSRKSDYVLGELAIAKLNNKVIFPIWTHGEQWIDCVPLSMTNYQYSDCRGSQYDAGINHLIDALHNVLDTSAGEITISLPSHELIQLNLKQFDKFSNFLDHLFLNYLYQWYDAYTYGDDWLLVNTKTGQVAITWNWLGDSKPNTSTHDMFFPRWYENESIDYFGIQPDSTWGVCEVSRLKVVGLCINSDSIRAKLLSRYRARDLRLLQNRGCLETIPSTEIDYEAYKSRFIISLSGSGFDLTQPRESFNRVGLKSAITDFNRLIFCETASGC